jgi:hypothetical protein
MIFKCLTVIYFEMVAQYFDLYLICLELKTNKKLRNHFKIENGQTLKNLKNDKSSIHSLRYIIYDIIEIRYINS